ncbi:glutathione S-transferase family protein [Janthinobacterium sp. 1_2014MBL_MicDiv]|uniref:glutathione S-transferase family protein n=1 Tax=Janthinobacterium sp. 1_2014MBL_MicDiv TaxID=1644131 RepID=UPI0008F4B199|nr:glutathione S-transferase family protein [Janthinobacterium sp. 1_2014MBL_MicDiv]APA68680.1 glutathione S-transferase [Janthinobacterium sp. 1_2014MBL_MicDiv]
MIELYTDSSPNGFKATIALAELGLPYRLRHVRIEQGEHRQAAFLALNPHGRIPVLVDHEAGITVFESAAILLYLAEKTGRLLPAHPAQRWAAITWLAFHAASMGPLLGQRVHFEIAEAGANAAAAAHFRQLCDAAFATMEGRLAACAYLAGDEYSMADIASFGWLHIARLVGFDFSAWPHVRAWYARVAARPAVRLGISIPAPATGA